MQLMKMKCLLFVLFVFSVVFDAHCSLRFNYNGTSHLVTTGKHVTVKWPSEVGRIRDEAVILFKTAQLKQAVVAEEIGACVEKIDEAISRILLGKDLRSLNVNDKLVVGHLCNLKDKLSSLLTDG